MQPVFFRQNANFVLLQVIKDPEVLQGTRYFLVGFSASFVEEQGEPTDHFVNCAIAPPNAEQ